MAHESLCFFLYGGPRGPEWEGLGFRGCRPRSEKAVDKMCKRLKRELSCAKNVGRHTFEPLLEDEVGKNVPETTRD